MHNDVIGEPVYVSTAAATHKHATIQRRRVGMVVYNGFVILPPPHQIKFLGVS